MTSHICSLKKIKPYIGSLLFFSFILQSTAPLIAAVNPSATLAPKTSQTVHHASTINNAICDTHLSTIIKQIIDDAIAAEQVHAVSEPLKRCYRTLAKGMKTLPIEDLWQAMPEILQYVIEQHTTKAARPDAPKPITTSAVTGPGACDVTQILELLVTIKNRIGCASDDVCCKTVLGILGDACEKFGPDSNISCKLLEICEKLIDLDEDLSECCEAIREDIADLGDQLEECCTEIREDISDSQTLICAKIDTINMDIDEIIETLEECCTEIREDIDDLGDQLDECCEDIRQDIFDSQTIICAKIETINMDVDEIIETLEECCTEIQEGLDDLGDQLDECCTDIREDIFDTKTIICDKLENLSVTVIDCDFFITQLPTGDSNNHPINEPITQPGVYCLAEDVIGTLVIDSDDVVVKFNNHTLSTTSPGVTIRSHARIRIENGTIRPSDPANTAPDIGIVAVNVVDIEIENMNLVGNALGIAMDETNNIRIENVDIYNGQRGFIFDECQRAKINCCQIFNNTIDNPTENIDGFIIVDTCRAMLFNDVHVDGNVLTAATPIPIYVLDSAQITLNSSSCNNNRITNTEIASFDLICFENSEDCQCVATKVILNEVSSGTIINGSAFGTFNENEKIIFEHCSAQDNIATTTTLESFQDSPENLVSARMNGFTLKDGTSRWCSIIDCFAKGNAASSDGGTGGSSTGFDLRSAANNCVLKNNTSIGHDYGIRLNGGNVTNCQVVSNHVLDNDLIGIWDISNGTNGHQIYNNIANNNSTNYVGVALVRTPGPHTGFYTNVTDGPQDCDLCDTVTLCCNDIREDIVDLGNQFDECCEDTRLDILDTRTIICDKIGDITDPIIDTSGFASAADVENTQATIISYLKTILSKQLGF